MQNIPVECLAKCETSASQSLHPGLRGLCGRGAAWLLESEVGNKQGETVPSGYNRNAVCMSSPAVFVCLHKTCTRAS